MATDERYDDSMSSADASHVDEATLATHYPQHIDIVSARQLSQSIVNDPKLWAS